MKLTKKYGTPKAKAGTTAKKSGALLEFDIANSRAEGYDLTTPIVVTNTNDFLDVTAIKTSTINELTDLLTIVN